MSDHIPNPNAEVNAEIKSKSPPQDVIDIDLHTKDKSFDPFEPKEKPMKEENSKLTKKDIASRNPMSDTINSLQ